MPRTILRRPTLAFAAAAFWLCALAPAAAAARPQEPAPDPEFEQAVVLYRKGDVKGAVKGFRSAAKRKPEDPAIWVYLGQALVRRGELKEARKAFDAALRLKPDYAAAHSSLAYLFVVAQRSRDAEREAAKALELDDKLADAHYVLGLLRLREGAWLKAIEEADAVVRLDPRVAAAYSLKTQALLGLYERGGAVLSEERRGTYDYDEATIKEARAAQPQRLNEAAENLETYLRLRPDAEDAEGLRDELEALRFYAEAASSSDPERKIYSMADGITRAEITFKPEPAFTDEARNANISGVVRLRAVLASDGTVKHIIVLRRLSHGLTEKSVAAARKIRFKPATLNGRPVHQVVMLEYNFNVY